MICTVTFFEWSNEPNKWLFKLNIVNKERIKLGLCFIDFGKKNNMSSVMQSILKQGETVREVVLSWQRGTVNKKSLNSCPFRPTALYMHSFTIYTHYTARHNVPHSILIYSCPSGCLYSAQKTYLILYSFIHAQAVAILLSFSVIG